MKEEQLGCLKEKKMLLLHSHAIQNDKMCYNHQITNLTWYRLIYSECTLS
jgi:hypothetical protein